MRTALASLAALILALAVWAGPVTPVAVTPPDGLLPASQRLEGEARFAARREGDGTVHPAAAIATFPRKGGAFRLAVDAAVAEADVPDCVRVDLTGAGTFAGAECLPMETQVAHEGHFDGVFGPKVVTALLGGVRTPVTVRGTYHFSERGQHMTVFVGTALEGACAFGGEQRRVRIVDGNANLAFGDAVVPQADAPGGFSRGDRVIVDVGDGAFGGAVREGLYGQPILVDGAWYRVALSPDGKSVSAEQATVPTARIAVPHLIWSAVLVGERHVLDLRGNRREILIPADRYTVAAYRETAPNPLGPPSVLTRGAGGPAVEAKADALTVPAWGSPLVASVKTIWDAKWRVATFSSVLYDAAGVEVTVELAGGRKWDEAAELDVVAPNGDIVYHDVFEHG